MEEIIERMRYHAEHYALLLTREELLEWAETIELYLQEEDEDHG